MDKMMAYLNNFLRGVNREIRATEL